ncbi:glucosidase II beta subunit-like-domain-containing protein [Chytriomyces sp. MP71]|nr:glucosidase II beta subunit-like-domain-containing protein [Chytriomyces sp. MP71]
MKLRQLSIKCMYTPLLLVLVAAATAAFSARINPLLGVHPNRLVAYRAAVASGSDDIAATFACLDGSRSISVSSLNDDYCDCDDGSDEAGTSACSDVKFYCQNKNHIGAEIPSSRVNDGICDPECCDGSDEYSGLIQCENVCEKIGAEFKRKQREKMHLLSKGLKIKHDYIAHAKKARADRKIKMKDLDAQVYNLTARIDELKVVKDQAELYEAHLNALRAQQTAEANQQILPDRIARCNERKQMLRGDVSFLNERVLELQRILDNFMGLKYVEEGAAYEALLRDKPVLQQTAQRYEDFKEQWKVTGTGSESVVTLEEELVEDTSLTNLPEKMSRCLDRKGVLRGNVEFLNARVLELQAILDAFMGLRDVEDLAAYEVLLRDKPILQQTAHRYESFKSQWKADGSGGRESTVTLEDEPADEAAALTVITASDAIVDLNDPCVDPAASIWSCISTSVLGLSKSGFGLLTYPTRWPGWAKIRSNLRNPFVRLSRSEEDELLRKDAGRARTRLSEVENEKRELEQKLDEVKRKDSLDTGLQGEWDKIADECISIDSFEYNYSICFLGDATQTPKNGGGGTNLGKFSRWGPRAGNTLLGKYHYMMFENGQHCWNGPHRSVEVAFECGPENKILTVSEPSKCEYAMRVQSPAVCDEKMLADEKRVGGDDSADSAHAEL